MAAPLRTFLFFSIFSFRAPEHTGAKCGTGSTMQGEGQTQQHRAASQALLSADMVQRVLDENQQLILAVIENQHKLQAHECSEYLSKLHRNLMMLATFGDNQVNTPGLRRWVLSCELAASV